MIVYRSAVRRNSAAAVLDGLAARLSGAMLAHDALVSALIDAGELEAALTDRVCREVCTLAPCSRAARTLTDTFGAAVVASWSGEEASATAARSALLALRSCFTSDELHATLELRVPEGYAYYALHPETYAAAARAFFAASRPKSVTVVGIRSIGTSLASVVSASLAQCGASVRSVTVRPRGHPFDRRLSLGDDLVRWLRDGIGGWFAIVDEGPGISGSSFTAVAEALNALGVPDHRIALFPSWLTNGSGLANERARERWRRHRSWVGSFEQEMLASGRIAAAWGGGTLAELSAGAWRERVFSAEREWPAVQPQHEQRKLLLRSKAGDELLLRFVGLGAHGAPREARAQRLFEAGFTPEPRGLANGFLAQRWIDGPRLRATDVDDAFLDRVADYLAWLRANEHAPADTSADDLVAMVRHNARELLGDGIQRELGMFASLAPTYAAGRPVAIDGRMMPHEWVHDGARWLKVDALSHHDDHFLPGPQDVSWDVAGAEVELALGCCARGQLLDALVARTGDTAIAERLPFARVAYAALRGGYARLAAQSLGDSADGVRMRADEARYARALRAALIACAAEPAAA